MAKGTITQIDTTYLDNLKHQLQDLQAQVEQQLQGLGTKGVTPNTLSFIEPLSSQLTIAAGAASFDAGAALKTALNAMGGSVHDQLTWLDKVLGDFISEIITTVASFKNTEDLNNESVDQLLNDFKNTIGDMNSPAGSGDGNPPKS